MSHLIRVLGTKNGASQEKVILTIEPPSSLLFIFFKLNMYYFVYLCMYMCVDVPVQTPEHKLWELVSLFHHISSGRLNLVLQDWLQEPLSP